MSTLHCQLTLTGSLHAELEGKDLDDLEAGRCLQEIVLTCPDTQRRRGEAFSLGIRRLSTSLFSHTERCCSDHACKSQDNYWSGARGHSSTWSYAKQLKLNTRARLRVFKLKTLKISWQKCSAVLLLETVCSAFQGRKNRNEAP